MGPSEFCRAFRGLDDLETYTSQPTPLGAKSKEHLFCVIQGSKHLSFSR